MEHLSFLLLGLLGVKGMTTWLLEPISRRCSSIHESWGGPAWEEGVPTSGKGIKSITVQRVVLGVRVRRGRLIVESQAVSMHLQSSDLNKYW